MLIILVTEDSHAERAGVLHNSQLVAVSVDGKRMTTEDEINTYFKNNENYPDIIKFECFDFISRPQKLYYSYLYKLSNLEKKLIYLNDSSLKGTIVNEGCSDCEKKQNREGLTPEGLKNN